MRAAFWWIDRWRQSRAFTDMTAEEQGLYRNLCDEVWLREDDGHVIPDDQRILAKVSGDPEAWSRCGAKVLRWMTKTPKGWTNETAMEVIGQSKQRAERQKKYRDDKRNAKDNASRNDARNADGSEGITEAPSLGSGSGSGEGTENRTATEARKATASAAAPKAVKAKWVSEACDDWNERYGLGSAPGGRIGNALKPIVQAMAKTLHETDPESWAGSVRPAWRRYLAETTHPSPSAQDFAAHFADWSVAQTGSALVPSGPRRITDPEPDPRDMDRQADEIARRRRSA
jgi:uncharacterized protein YdaU (DUF1376 family)